MANQTTNPNTQDAQAGADALVTLPHATVVQMTDYVKHASEMLTEHSQFMGTLEREAAKTVDYLIGRGLLKEAQRDRLIEAFTTDPNRSFSFMAKLADQAVRRGPASMGTPEPAKTASTRSTASGSHGRLIGERGGMSAADAAFVSDVLDGGGSGLPLGAY